MYNFIDVPNMGLVAYDNKEHLVKVSTIIPQVEISKKIISGNSNSTINNSDDKTNKTDKQGKPLNNTGNIKNTNY